MIITHDDDSFSVSLIEQVDTLADKFRLAVVGDPVRVKEYEVAQSQATAFRAAGYAGPVPEYVSDWSIIKSWTNQAAADDILAAADRWLAALGMIRTKRLLAKENIRVATTLASKQKVYDDFASFMNAAFAGFV